MLTSIPAIYRILAVLAFLSSVFFYGMTTGRGQIQAQWDAAAAKQTAQIVDLKERQADASIKVVTKYVDRVQVIRQQGADIIKELPVYVTREADSSCVLPRGFVRLHDAAAAGRIAETAGDSDASAAGVALSTVAGTVADNYQRCHENAEELIGLQDWIRQQQTLRESQ